VNTQPLSNLRVLVTRPHHQARGFIDNIASLGGLVFHLPTIEIVYRSHKLPLPDADLIVFTSVNAVIGAKLNGATFKTHKTQLIAAIGTATKSALHDAGFNNIVSPKTNGNSESLLALLEAHIFPSMKITIVRGDSGRDVLRDSLLQLGAQVNYEEVYQRKLPALSSVDIPPAQLWQQASPDIVSVSSDLGLVNLIAMLPVNFHQQLFAKPLIVNSERCMQKALTEGFTAEILVADPPGDRGQVDQLTRYAQSKS